MTTGPWWSVLKAAMGGHTVEYAEKIGLGSRKYELKELKPQQAV